MFEERSEIVKKITNSQEFEKILIKLKKKDEATFNQLAGQMEKTARIPNIGKPLRYSLRNNRRLHIGSFVLVYEFLNGELKFLDFDHHDKIYKKYK
ncbi:MAG: type II toxin-antitoxin system RelE/ParE family toxin [bacterium]|nr:type II toxin-antitoxin system RelE/ParE family toxin [bacterium]